MANEKRKRSTSSTNCNNKKSKPSNSKETKSDHCNSLKKSKRLKSVNTPINVTTFLEESIVKEDNTENVEVNGTNFVNTFIELQKGNVRPSTLQKIVDEFYIQRIKSFHIFGKFETRDLRVTSSKWHPHYPHLYVWGGKHGSVHLFKVLEEDYLKEIHTFNGMGPGCAMEAVDFNTKRSGIELCTASVEGTVSSYNFDTQTRVDLIHSDAPEKIWFTAVAVHQDGNIYAGDTRGLLSLHHLDNNETVTLKLHSSKIKHLEFNSRYPHLMVSASTDKSVKLWDMRNLTKSLECLKHDNGVSAAKFSLSNGCRLLTTDQMNQVRVYKAPLWTLEHNIQHPHRQFQHMTPIKASWHPHADVFVIGRYPDPKLPNYDPAMRSVDVFSAASGQLRYELMETSKLITSLAEFNSTGTILSTTTVRKTL